MTDQTSDNTPGLLYLTASDMQSLGVTVADVARLLEEVFRHKAAGETVVPPGTLFHRQPLGWFNSLISFVPPLGFAGCKFQCGSPKPAPGAPSIQGLYILSENASGAMVALMDSRWLTAIRTAAVGALMARYEAPPGARQLAILGCGLQGRLQLEALKSGAPTLETCLAYDIDPAAARRYADEMDGRFGVAVTPVDSAEAAVRGSDIVMTAGPILKDRRPVIAADWLKPGCFVFAQDRDCYVTDDAIRAMDAVVTDDRADVAQAQAHEGFFAAVTRVDKELSEIVRDGRGARRRPEDRVLALMLGIGLEDLGAAVEYYRRAKARGVGTMLPPGWR